MNMVNNKQTVIQRIRSIVNVNSFLSQKIQPQIINKFSSILILLQNQLKTSATSQLFFQQRIRDIMTMFREKNRQYSINLIVKKLIFLQFFIRFATLNKFMGNQTIQKLIAQINGILKQDLINLSKPKRQKVKSLQKISTFFRDLSGSKQKNSSKMKLQQLDQRQTVKQIIKTVFQPYCSYLLKIINQSQTYHSILVRQQIVYTNLFMWKLINWNVILSKIILNLNRIGRYFTQDFIGVWVHCSYMISQDVSIFYSILRKNIENQSQKWVQKLLIAKKFFQINRKSNKQKILELFSNDQLQQVINLKKQIDEIQKIKEDNNYLYINKNLCKWKSSFENLPRDIIVLNRQNYNHSDQLLALIATLGKYKEFQAIFTDKMQKFVVEKRKNNQTQRQMYEQSKKMQPNEQTKANNLQSKLNRRNNIFTQKRNRILGRT